MNHPGQPRITWYGEGGARIEISGANFFQWVAKIGNAFVEEGDVSPGSTVALACPMHYLTMSAACAAWAIGATVDVVDGEFLVTDVAPQRHTAEEVFGVNLVPLARSMPQDSSWWDVDLIAASMSAADQLQYGADSTPSAPVFTDNSPVHRTLVVGSSYSCDQLVELTSTLLGGGSLVLATAPELDLAHLQRTESTTCTTYIET